jgi:hypothetical protein
MIDYKNGKIYTVNLGDKVLYVGSTVQTLAARWNGHQMRAPGRLIKLYEKFPCSDKFKLRHREEEVRLALCPPLNKNACWTGIPSGLSKQEYDTHPVRKLIKNAYDATHRVENRTRLARKVVCDCGQTITVGTLARHKKRSPHKKLMTAGHIRANLARAQYLKIGPCRRP